jgi:hypothetical protein
VHSTLDAAQNVSTSWLIHVFMAFSNVTARVRNTQTSRQSLGYARQAWMPTWILCCVAWRRYKDGTSGPDDSKKAFVIKVRLVLVGIAILML